MLGLGYEFSDNFGEIGEKGVLCVDRQTEDSEKFEVNKSKYKNQANLFKNLGMLAASFSIVHPPVEFFDNKPTPSMYSFKSKIGRLFCRKVSRFKNNSRKSSLI